MNTDGKNLENVKMFERRKIKTVEVTLTVTHGSDSVAVFKRRLACVNLVNFCS